MPMITKQSVKISIVVTGQSLLSGGCVFKEAAPPTSRGIRRADRASIVPLLADRIPHTGDGSCVTVPGVTFSLTMVLAADRIKRKLDMGAGANG